MPRLTDDGLEPIETEPLMWQNFSTPLRIHFWFMLAVVWIGGMVIGYSVARAGGDWPVSRAVDAPIHYRHGEILTIDCVPGGTDDRPFFDCRGISFLPQLLGVWTYRVTPLTSTSYAVSRLRR